MKFYEFSGGFPYYALITANSEYEALGLYIVEISTLDEGWWEGKIPLELTKEEAEKKYTSAPWEETREDVEKPEQAFERISLGSEPSVLLIDSSLI